MALTDIQIRTAKSKEKDYKLSDSEGLYILIAKTGGKRWRFKYRFSGKEKLLALGTYPDISLQEARTKLREARNMLANGFDPGSERKAQKEIQTEKVESEKNTFEVVAREWHKKNYHTWAPSHAKAILNRLQKDVFPWLGDKPIKEIKPIDLLAILRRVEERGTLETAHRVRVTCGQVFRYAIATARTDRNIAADLKGALPPVPENHYPAFIDPKAVTGLLRAIDGFQGTFVVKCALQLSPILFLRPGELRQLEWVEVDFENKQINLPSEKMKMKLPHIVPLAKQSVSILEELKPLTGLGRYVFPSLRTASRPMSENTINATLRRLGYDTRNEMTGHGFRAMARTILDEVLHVRPDFIEHQLAHTVRDPNGRAYNRTAHLAERRKMMQMWADYLDGLKTGAKVIQLKRFES